MLSNLQRETCLQIIRTAEEGRRRRGLALAQHGHEVTLKPTENGNLIMRFLYEKEFWLSHRSIVEQAHDLVLMSDGTAACDCPDSMRRRTICKHAVCCVALLLEDVS